MEPQYVLPRELVYKIISYLDIDTRRSLGIYTKLKIPQILKNKIKFQKIYHYCDNEGDYDDYGHYTRIYCISFELSRCINEYRTISYTIYHTFYDEGILYRAEHTIEQPYINPTNTKEIEELTDYMNNYNRDIDEYGFNSNKIASKFNVNIFGESFIYGYRDKQTILHLDSDAYYAIRYKNPPKNIFRE